MLNPTQLGEIFLNEALGDLTGNFVKRRFGDPDLMNAKMDALKEKMNAMTIANLGENHDAVIAAIPSSWYKFLDPLTAIMSNSFDITITGLVQLFQVSWSALKALAVDVFRGVKAAFSAISSLGITPNRVFMVAQILIGLLTTFPALSSLVFGERVQDYMKGLSLLGGALRVVSSLVTKTVIERSSMSIETAQSLLPVRWFKSSSIVRPRKVIQYILPRDVNIRIGPAVPSDAKGLTRGRKQKGSKVPKIINPGKDNAAQWNRNTWMVPFEEDAKSKGSSTTLFRSSPEEAPTKAPRATDGWWPVGRDTSRRPSKPSHRHTKPPSHPKPTTKPTVHKKPVGSTADIDYEKLRVMMDTKFKGRASETNRFNSDSSSFD
jgi:hypothetical protein